MPRSHGNEDESDDMVLRVLALMRRQAGEKAKQREEKEKARSRYPNFQKNKERAARAIAPLKPADEQSVAPKDMLFAAKRTNASQHLPEHYLVYFLLVDLLDYKDLGRWEKMAYSIPVDFNGTAYLIEHRKFGLGLFAADPETQEGDATAVVDLIRKAMKSARPYFEHLANEAAEGSRLNLTNHSRALYDRFLFLRKIFHEKQEEAALRKDERVVEKGVTENGVIRSESFLMPIFELRREARWLGLAAVEAFFSWTEHVFIHIAVLRVRPETLCRITEFSEHESNGRELDEGERVAVEVLPVLGQSAAAVEPGDGAFDHPTPGLDDEALHPIGSLDDLGLEIGQDAGQGAVKDRPLIGAVGEQFPEKGKQTEQGRQQRETAVAILNVGGGDDAVQQQALRIDQNMPLLALDQLAGIEAVAVDASPPFSALFTL